MASYKKKFTKRKHRYSSFCKLTRFALVCFLVVWLACFSAFFLPCLDLTEPFYLCYLRHFPLKRAWLGDVTLPPVSVGQEGEGRGGGGGGGQERQQSRWTGGTPTPSQLRLFSVTHCFVIVPMALCPHRSAGWTARQSYVLGDTHTHTHSAVFVSVGEVKTCWLHKDATHTSWSKFLKSETIRRRHGSFSWLGDQNFQPHDMGE